METDRLIDVFRNLMTLAIRLGGPMLIVCMIVGVVLALMQAVTQIHEQSIAFLMKLAVVVVFLSLGGSWMLHSIHDFALELFQLMVWHDV